MITCKEDMINTRITNDLGALREAYVNKAIELGFPHQGGVHRELEWYNLPTVAILTRWGPNLGQSHSEVEGKELTLSDFKKPDFKVPDLKKPRTKVEYVECNQLQDALDKFETNDGTEFYYDDYGLDRISSVRSLALAYGKTSLYRKVESEITWREELEDFLESDGSDMQLLTILEIAKWRSTGDKTDSFLTMCHLVAEMTDKP